MSSYPPPPPPGYEQGGHGTPPAAPRNGLGVAALVLGILGLVGAWVPIVGIGGGVLGLVAVILGIVGRKRAARGQATNGGLALAGIITGALAVVLAVVVTIVSVQAFNRSGGADLIQCMTEAQGDQAAIEQCEQQFGEQLNQ